MSRFSRPPFFVLGSVRSGTTMLRQILQRHPALVCPEETHLFRWPYPFGTQDYRNVTVRNRTLKRHREIDGIGEDEFEEILSGSLTRRALIESYMEAYAAKQKPEATRWFEKSPQNVYGIQLIQALFPQARFLHIVRHPLEVVSSLKVGKVMKVPSVVGAANYWLEAVSTICNFAKGNAGVLWQARYEDFTQRPRQHVQYLFDFLGEPFDDAIIDNLTLAAASHRTDSVLTEAETATAWDICGDLALSFGYECWPFPPPHERSPEEDASAAAAAPSDGGPAQPDSSVSRVAAPSTAL